MTLRDFAKQSVRRRKAAAAGESKDERNASVTSGLPLQATKRDAKETDYEEDVRARSRGAGAEGQDQPN